MPHKQTYQHRLLQKMVLTPQMRQSLNLLGMPLKDLSEYIETALANNPFLKKIIENKPDHHKAISAYAQTDDIKDRTANLKQKDDPRSSLLSQVRISGAKGSKLEIAEYLIYEMDDNGYIKISAEEAAADLAVDPDDVQEAIDLIQSMDPPGIGAADIRECMQIQLRRIGKERSAEYEIVSGFLNELARNDYQAISKSLGIEAEKIRTAAENIKRLNPRPASSMLSAEAERVIPEVIVNADGKKVRIELNRSAVPGLKIYNPYENELDIIKDPEARKFLKENMEYAKGLVDGLKRREDTVCRVTEHILNYHREMFGGKPAEMKSLTINDVAKALGFHPSTISRVLSNKFIQVNGKVMPLKSLLSHSVTKKDGMLSSKAAVKEKLRAIVAAEDRKSPLSDEALREMLDKEGIALKRRTVAKYRESLKILPSRLRRKL